MIGIKGVEAAEVNQKHRLVIGSLLLSIIYAIMAPEQWAISVLALAMFILIWVSRRWLLQWRNLIILYLAILFLIPVNIYRLPVHLPFDLEPQRLFLFSILACWIVSLLIDPSVRFRRTPVDGVLLLLFGVGFLSLIINASNFEPVYEFSQAAKALIYLFSFILVFYFIVSVFRSNEEIETIAKIIVILGAILSIFGIVERLTSINIFRHLHEMVPLLVPQKLYGDPLMRGGIRVTGSAEHPIAFGALLALIVPLAIYFMVSAKSKYLRFVYGSAFMLIVIGMVITVSRTALLGFIAEIVVLAIAQKMAINRVKIAALAIIILFIVHIIFPGVLGAFRATLSSSYFKQHEIENNYGRYTDYPKIIDEFSKYPILGRGFGTFDPVRFFYVDNQYLKLLVEIGISGLAMVLLFISQLIRRLWLVARYFDDDDNRRNLLLSIAASIVAFAIMSATYDTFGFPQAVYFFFVLAALGTAYMLNIKPEGLRLDSLSKCAI